jgi:hypothetical protein
MPCNRIVNSAADDVSEGGDGEDGVDDAEVHVCCSSFRPGPSQRDVSDAMKSAEKNLSKAGWRVLSSNGRVIESENKVV